jgi:hypothetical protein
MYSYKQMFEWYTNRIKMIEVKFRSEYITKFINLNLQHPYNVLNFVTPYAEYPLCVVNPDFFCCKQIPFVTGSWNLDSRGCKGFQIYTGFHYAQVPFNKGFTTCLCACVSMCIYVCVYVHEAIISLMTSEDVPYPLNLLKPTCHVMHKQLNVQQLYALPTLYLSENKQRLVSLTDKLVF